MRKLYVFAFLFCCLLTACIEIENSTTIHADGSGVLVTELDMSALVSFMKASKSGSKKEDDFQYDTLISLQSVTDTASQLNDRQKQLLRNAEFRMQASARESLMKFRFSCPFAKLEEVQEISELLGSPIFDQYFDQALALTGMNEGSSEEKKGNSNLFGTMSPNYLDYKFKKGKLECTVNQERLQTFRSNWNNSAEDEGESDRQLMELISYVHRINLPADGKKLSGDKIQEDGSARSWIQKGDILDLYEHPEKYAIIIKY